MVLALHGATHDLLQPTGHHRHHRNQQTQGVDLYFIHGAASAIGQQEEGWHVMISHCQHRVQLAALQCSDVSAQ